jgi:membrane protein implicated in regulation of membrane protease activity
MVEILGGVLSVLLLMSFAALCLYFVVGAGLTALTLRRARRERQLTDDLDRVLVQILGPRSEVATTSTLHQNRRSRSL